MISNRSMGDYSMKTLIAASAALLMATSAVAQTPEPEAYQVLRAGDRDMTCEALASESNSLNAKLMADQQAAAKHAQRSSTGRGLVGGLAGGVLGGAARYGLARGMIGGAFSPALAQGLVAVSDSASVAVGTAVANSGQQAAAPTVTPEQQRMNHLLGLYKEKGC